MSHATFYDQDTHKIFLDAIQYNRGEIEAMAAPITDDRTDAILNWSQLDLGIDPNTSDIINAIKGVTKSETYWHPGRRRTEIQDRHADQQVLEDPETHRKLARLAVGVVKGRQVSILEIFNRKTSHAVAAFAIRGAQTIDSAFGIVDDHEQGQGMINTPELSTADFARLKHYTEANLLGSLLPDAVSPRESVNLPMPANANDALHLRGIVREDLGQPSISASAKQMSRSSFSNTVISSGPDAIPTHSISYGGLLQNDALKGDRVPVTMIETYQPTGIPLVTVHRGYLDEKHLQNVLALPIK